MNTPSILKQAGWWPTRWTTLLRNGIGHLAALVVRYKSLAPYALIELVLPGGSVMALLLWLYRRRKNGVAVDSAIGSLQGVKAHVCR